MTALRFVSSNPNKIAEVRRIVGASVEPVPLDLPEVQGGSVEEIVRMKLAALPEPHRAGLVAVEDVSLELEGLGRFPGPYVKWLLREGGGEALARMASAAPGRRARARCCVGALIDGREELFEGDVAGTITSEPAGDLAFGWDPWFVPSGLSRTFAELDPAEKDAISHRGIAWRSLAARVGIVR